jgi:SWI/SNF complex component SWP73
MKEWVESQLETLRALKSDEGFHEQTVRRADYYEKNDELLKEKIDIMLGANRI